MLLFLIVPALFLLLLSACGRAGEALPATVPAEATSPPAGTAPPTETAVPVETVAPVETAAPATETAVSTAAPTAPPAQTAAVATRASGAQNVRLAAGGGGDFATLAEAVAGLAAGSTITLDAGVYELPQTLAVELPLTIRGAGREETVLLLGGGGSGLSYSGDGRLQISDLTLSHGGGRAADVLSILAGELDLADCRVEGGVRAQGQANFGAGLFLENEARAAVRGCEFLFNMGAGVELIEAAQIDLRESLLAGNGSAGLLFDGTSGGLISGNEISDNAGDGILVFAQAAPRISENLIENNAGYGLYYQLDAAGGVAGDNRLLYNNTRAAADPGTDIHIVDSFAPDLAGNVCSSEITVSDLAALQDAVDASGIVFFGAGAGQPGDAVRQDNACAVALCGIAPGAEEFELQCVNQ